jgi:hypothetical protein
VGQAKFVCGIADALAPGRGLEPLQRLERRQPLKIDLLLHNTPPHVRWRNSMAIGGGRNW